MDARKDRDRDVLLALETKAGRFPVSARLIEEESLK
jgi:hypothetical protein